MREKTTRKKHGNKIGKVFIAGFAVIALVSIFLIPAFAGDFYKNTTFDGKNISGFTYEQFREYLDEEYSGELEGEVKLINGEKTLSIDFSDLRVSYDIDGIYENATQNDKGDNYFSNIIEFYRSLFLGTEIEKKIVLNESLCNQKIREFSAMIETPVTEPFFEIAGENLVVNRGEDGYLVDKDLLKETLFGHIFSDDFGNIEVPLLHTKREEVDIEKIYAQVKSDPMDAQFISKGEDDVAVQEHVVGYDFDVEQAKKIEGQSKEKQLIVIPLKVTMPEILSEDLTVKLFADKIASYTSKLNPGLVNRDRKSTRLNSSH